MSFFVQAAAFAALATGAAAATSSVPMQVQTRIDPGAHASRLAQDVMAPGQGQTLNEPLGIAVDHAGNLYVANLNTGVTIYNPKLQLTGQITSVSLPTAVAVNFTDDRIVVTSGATYAISIFDQSHTQVGTIVDQSLRYPLGMYVDGNDDVWLLDNTGTVHGYLLNGTSVGAIQTGGTAIGPFGSNWAIWGSPYQNQSYPFANFFGNLGLALHNGPAVTGGYLNNFAPYGAAEDAQHNVYLTDATHTNVTEQFYPGNSTGGIIAVPSTPYGIAVDSARDRIYVSFPQTNTIGVYGLKSHKLMKTLY